jgi:tetraacyldisaccharide 4'-kinase
MSFVERVWFGADPAAGAMRAALWPLSATFGAIAATRRALYASRVLRTHQAALPCISVGNLTVGGTGKTPFAAWLATKLNARARTAIVLRGYGGDEAEVHRRLAPGVGVVALADRVVAVHMAKAANAQLVVLDDAFQHRRISRVADIVLVSAEQMARPVRLLPSGPWREPLESVRRADLIVVTAKSASPAEVQNVLRAVVAEASGAPVAVVRLTPGKLERYDSKETLATERLSGAKVLAIAAIGEPDAFRRQLEALGARVSLRAFRDHHSFSADEVRALAESASDSLAVCTLKDAVKLAPLWPPSRALWYLSQHLVIEQGGEHIDRLCARMWERVSNANAG